MLVRASEKLAKPTFDFKYEIYRFAIYPKPFAEAEQCPELPITKRRMQFDQMLNALQQHFVESRWDLAYRARPQPGAGKLQNSTHSAYRCAGQRRHHSSDVPGVVGRSLAASRKMSRSMVSSPTLRLSRLTSSSRNASSSLGRRQRAEVYVPLIHRAGDEAQVDFFEVTVELNGQWHKAWKFLLRLMNWEREFVWLYNRCDTVAFSTAMRWPLPTWAAFHAAAVRKIIEGQRKLTKRFEALVSHYLFEPCFARVGEGHDKGGVESRGKAIRLQHLAPVPRGESLSAIADTLIIDLEQAVVVRRNAEGRSLAELWAEERPQLLLLPAPPFRGE
jgi:hypothetical protein